jgi:hypothetical protein
MEDTIPEDAVRKVPSSANGNKKKALKDSAWSGTLSADLQ